MIFVFFSTKLHCSWLHVKMKSEPSAAKKQTKYMTTLTSDANRMNQMIIIFHCYRIIMSSNYLWLCSVEVTSMSVKRFGPEKTKWWDCSRSQPVTALLCHRWSVSLRFPARFAEFEWATDSQWAKDPDVSHTHVSEEIGVSHLNFSYTITFLSPLFISLSWLVIHF